MRFIWLLAIWFGGYATLSGSAFGAHLAPCCKEKTHACPIPSGRLLSRHAGCTTPSGSGDQVFTGSSLQVQSSPTGSAASERSGFFWTRPCDDNDITSPPLMVWDLFCKQVIKRGLLPDMWRKLTDLFCRAKPTTVATATYIAKTQDIAETQVSASRCSCSQRSRCWQGQAAQTAQGREREGQGESTCYCGSSSACSCANYPLAEAPCKQWARGNRGRRPARCASSASWRRGLIASILGRASAIFPGHQREVHWQVVAQASGPTDRGPHAATEASHRSATVSRGLGRLLEGADRYCGTAGGQNGTSERLRFSGNAMAVPTVRGDRPAFERQWWVASCPKVPKPWKRRTLQWPQFLVSDV